MSHPEIRTIRVPSRVCNGLAEILNGSLVIADSLIEDIEGDHLDDAEFVERCSGVLTGSAALRINQHLESCDACAAEAARIQTLAGFWDDAEAVAAMEKRVRGASEPRKASQKSANAPISRVWNTLASPFAVSLKSIIVPQGAYGETKEDESSTLEFFITHDGKIVEGLRGLLKRVNREYYVSIFAVDPNARSRYGDRKAVISISDTYQERPILYRKIDIGVTVLLGTDFRLTDNSCLAVEMLPSAN